MEIIFVPYDISNSLQKEWIFFLESYAKIYMNFGIFINKILLIEISSSKKNLSIFLDFLKKFVKTPSIVIKKFKEPM